MEVESMVLQHNLSALNANGSLKVTTKKQAKSSEKLSTGYKINRAADDAAGLTISEGMRCMVRGLNKASDNAQDGHSLLQTADGALEEVHEILQRAKELSVQAANDTNTQADRQAIQSEVDELLLEINRIADTTEFNTLKLLDGSKSAEAASNPFLGKTVQAGVCLEREGLQSVNGVTVKDPVHDPSVSGVDRVRLTNLESDLDAIVPKAVGAIAASFPASLGGSPNISPEIGVNLYADGSSTLAYVACSYSCDGSGKISGISLNLSVNVSHLDFDKTTNKLTDRSNKELQATIAHEMMHAFMDDALTNGMLGATGGYVDKSNQFPGWFKEGMAQTAAGGCSDYNDWVNGGLGLRENAAPDKISNVVKSSGNKLSSGTTASKYGTGYLACMYLGYLAAGANSVTSRSLAGGLDSMLKQIADGDSLSDVINQISNGKYKSLGDFQNKFGDSDSAAFISELLKAAGSDGSGSVITGSLGDIDVLAGAPSNTAMYKTNHGSDFVSSGKVHTFADGGSGGYNGNGQALNLQVGSLGRQGVAVSIDDTHTMALGLDGVSVMSFDEAGAAIADLDAAIDLVSANRSRIGAYMNRLEHTIANLDNTSENTQAAESRLRDTDMADEMVEYSANNILAQAGQSMLAQANQNPQGILSLFQ